MSISLEEVWHIAALARIGIDVAQATEIAAELSSILEHMEDLSRAAIESREVVGGETVRAMPLRPDTGPAIPLDRVPNDFAPAFRDGFFLVPRLSTHEDLDPAS